MSQLLSVTDPINRMLELLRDEFVDASWLVDARATMDPVDLYDQGDII